jgi:hypothetical protein|tara:strand:+ start:1316 stop:1573 length:258 start_codon:yes stop_codon:yes gene_type:complete
MNLEIPIPVTFTIKMITDKAIIAQNIMLKGSVYIREAVLPKMFTIISNTEDDVTTAVVDKWVLQQRYTEENTVDIDAHIEELLAV